jgi:hypothetical protein
MDFDQPYTVIGPRNLNIRRSDEDSPARAAWVAMLLASPVAAKRAAKRARVEYWRARVRRLKEDLRLAQAALEAAEQE